MLDLENFRRSLLDCGQVLFPGRWAALGCAAILTLFAAEETPAHASSVKQYEAYMTKFFLSHHQAVPLFSNGSVRSLDALRLPDETNFTSAETCFDGLVFQPLNLPDEHTQTTWNISATVGGKFPAYRLAELGAQIGGRVMEGTTLIFTPFAQEQQPDAISLAHNPKSIGQCPKLTDPVFMWANHYVLVAKVFRAVVWGGARLEVTGSIDASGQLISAAGTPVTKDAVLDLLSQIIAALGGATPKAEASVSGNFVDVYLSSFPDVQSVAFTSAFLNPDELARIYFRLRNGPSAKLDRLVNEYLYNVEPTILQRIGDEIRGLLSDIGLLAEGGTDEIYASLFSGEGAVLFSSEDLAAKFPSEQWEGLALYAAANVIAEQREVPEVVPQ